MRYLRQLFENNRRWAAQSTADDPDFFKRLTGIQAPDHLWIGCADSRVPANEIVGLVPGELFVHRNVANLVVPDDPNCLSVLQYAVDVLHVEHVIVCGHYECGGVNAALGERVGEPLESWLGPLRALAAEHSAELDALDAAARGRRLCELNILRNVRTLAALRTVREAWRRGQPLVLHGWIYDLHDGLLCDLDVSVAGLDEGEGSHRRMD